MHRCPLWASGPSAQARITAPRVLKWYSKADGKYLSGLKTAQNQSWEAQRGHTHFLPSLMGGRGNMLSMFIHVITWLPGGRIALWTLSSAIIPQAPAGSDWGLSGYLLISFLIKSHAAFTGSDEGCADGAGVYPKPGPERWPIKLTCLSLVYGDMETFFV